MLNNLSTLEHSQRANEESEFPWKHIIGFALSLVLTGATLWVGFGHILHGGPLQFIIMVFGVLQIVVQLLLFMHMSEGGTTSHIWMILLGFFFTFVVVTASIWIMTFSSQVQ